MQKSFFTFGAVFLLSVAFLVLFVPDHSRGATDVDLETLWEALTAPSSPAGERDAYQAIGALAGCEDRAVAFLRARLRPVEPIAETTVNGWLANLENTDFVARQEAMERLQGAGRLVRSVVQRKRDDSPSLDLRKRLDELVEGMDTAPLTADELRALRAVEALEKIGTRAARSLLEELASGAPDALLTQAARPAHNRLAQQKPGP